MSPSSAPLRWGILGCARICRRAILPGLRRAEFGGAAAIASRDGATARAWASEFGIARSYGAYEEILADPNIDAVYIPLPNELHRPWTLAAAEAGKHVLCEKPLAIDTAEAEDMADYCSKHGVLLREAFMWRHQPRSGAIRKMVDDGLIGDLRLIRSSFSFAIEPGDWRLDPSRGGGALWDVGCYALSTMRFFTRSEPLEIRGHARLSPSGVDLSLAAQLTFPGGVLGLLDCSFEQPFRCVYELVGSKGTIEVPRAYLPPRLPVAWLARDGHRRKPLFFPGRDQYACMFDDFARCVREGNAASPVAEDGVEQMRSLDRVLRASKTGAVA
ncbi:MAG: Gfo/Idh/MocA family oxidoreductase [Isosphaeraceae bacterium]